MKRLGSVLVVLFAATLSVIALHGAAVRVEIVQADYGSGNTHVDVTEQVRSLIRDHSLNFYVDNKTLGVDPRPGKVKVLRLQVRDNTGSTQVLAFRENEYVSLRVSNGIRPYAGSASGGLEINHAQYGAGGRFSDVTAQLNSQVQGDQLDLQVTNDTMGGGDPAPGQNKTLRVQYTYNGGMGQVDVNEGDTLMLPAANTSSISQSVRCESNNNRRKYCPVDTRAGVRLSRQLSSSACTQGSSWGFDQGGVWVDAGCRAEFEVLPFAAANPSRQMVSAASAPQLPDPGDTGVSKQQQEQLGLQTVAEVYKQMPVLPDSSPETQYVQQLGNKLVSVIPAQYSWPYQFHVISQKEINAFALPGGPVFINIGTITAADNEAELAGVLAHEMSHIYMQHSIKQMKTQQTEQGLAGLLGAILGQVGGVAGSLGQLGVGIGAGMISLKYSRGDEAQADAVGAIIMYQAGYDPKAMPQFFQKLEQQGGRNGPNFLSDHPNPGNRVASVEKEIRDWPPKNFQATIQAFVRARQHAQGVRAYTAEEIAQGAKEGTWASQNQRSGSVPGNLPASSGAGATNDAVGNIANVSYSEVRPSVNFAQTENNIFRISYPNNWQIYQGQNSGAMTIAPPAGISQGAVAYGVIVNGGQDQNASSLDQATRDLISNLEQSNSGLRVNGNPQHIGVNGVEGRSVELTGNSPVQQNGQPVRERDWLITLPLREGGLMYLVFVAPENAFGQLRPTYQRVLESLQMR